MSFLHGFLFALYLAGLIGLIWFMYASRTMPAWWGWFLLPFYPGLLITIAVLDGVAWLRRRYARKRGG